MPVTPPSLASTSVSYTIPASSSAASSLVSRARTSASLVSMAGVTPASVRISRPNCPQGTSSAQSPMSSSSLAKSARPVT